MKWVDMISSTVYGELSQGHKGMTEEQKFFVKQFNAYTLPSKQTFRQVVGKLTMVPATEPVNHLEVIEQEGVTITMPKSDYEIMCKKLNSAYEEEYLRTLNPQAFNLWMQYQTYVNLMK